MEKENTTTHCLFDKRIYMHIPKFGDMRYVEVRKTVSWKAEKTISEANVTSQLVSQSCPLNLNNLFLPES